MSTNRRPPMPPPAEVAQKFLLGTNRIPEEVDPSAIPPMPNLNLRKEASQCQNCFKPKTKTTLFQCKACKVDTYCSKECQTLAWRSHKPMCLINRSSNGLSITEGQVADNNDVMRRLLKFTNKHRRLLLETAIQALELWTDPSRSHNYAFVVYLRTREGSTKPEKYFYVTEAEVVPVDALNGVPSGRHQTLRESIEAETERVKQFGMTGSLLVLLMAWDVKEGGITMNKVPGGFAANTLVSSGRPWKQPLFIFLNNGLLV